MRGAVAVVLVAALAVSLAGCGGSNAKGTRTSKRAFAKQVEAICEHTQVRVVWLMRRGGEHPDQLAAARSQALTTYRRQVTELDAIEPPPKLADLFEQYKAILVSLNQGLEVRLREIAELEQQEVHDPTTKDHALAEREQALQRRATSIANGLGLHACN